MKTSWILVAALSFASAACSSDGGSDSNPNSNTGDTTTIVSTPLAGKVGGKAWTFVAGNTSAFLSEGEENFFSELYAETLASCDIIDQPLKDHLIVALPRVPGSYPLTLMRNATFSVRTADDWDNRVALKGRVVIDAVTATTIQGGAFIEVDANDSVNGQFQVNICAE